MTDLPAKLAKLEAKYTTGRERRLWEQMLEEVAHHRLSTDNARRTLKHLEAALDIVRSDMTRGHQKECLAGPWVHDSLRKSECSEECQRSRAVLGEEAE